jgi:acyl-CoA synthetase (AMP-forming)/AMP-acid ligase II
MKMPLSDRISLWTALRDTGRPSDCSVHVLDASVALGDLARCSSLGGRLEKLRGRSVLVTTKDQLTAALALVELDGVARRLVLCPPDLPAAHIPFVIATAAVDAVVSDRAPFEIDARSCDFVTCSPMLTPTDSQRQGHQPTEWILFTSGTSGLPKLVVHTLATLTRAIGGGRTQSERIVWSTFYDIRRYGGLQIFLRAVLGGRSLVLTGTDEPIGDFLTRAAEAGVTHISGTPSHWRRVLMSPWARRIAPRYVRLSGEIADQAILDSLRAAYPDARISHAFASTEAGVAFDIEDGLAGFPASLVGQVGGAVELKIEEGSLRIRSGRTAFRYVGGEALADHEGFVDTGDMVERRDDRFHFIGRKGGIINIGGLKVHPEEIEAVINLHPGVKISLVKARKNPITGAVVVADVVVASDPGTDGSTGTEALKGEILAACKSALPAYKVPISIRFVASLEVAPSGKLVRQNA